MFKQSFTFESKVWLYKGEGAWHFVSLPEELSGSIKSLFGHAKRGWGSLPINVTIGSTSWRTSIFPDKKRNCYLLPIKADIRKKENIVEGDQIKVAIEISD